ncbi:hypothetical protein ACFQ0G_02365 [Streptomyces chiangmaiensis]|uniref:hypothetical protein n=1 Tax=Streptomyces chiangmaiensis TaxID=766497 RepID=UPI0031EEAE55
MPLGAAITEIEGLYSALLRADSPERRRRLRADLTSAARRLASLAALPCDQSPRTPVAHGSRRQQRRRLAEGGAAWITAHYGQAKD